LDLSNANAQQLMVIDPMGRVVLQRKGLQAAEELDLQEMPAGTYLLLVQDVEGLPLAIERLLIQK
jgi:hypothetical protein